MNSFSRRTLVRGGMALSCACLANACATAARPTSGSFICPPCGCAMDGHEFEAAGQCPACGMDLVLKASAEVLIDAASLRADFTALYTGLQEAHFNPYARMSRATADQLFAQMLEAFDRPLTLLEARKRFQVFTAAGQVAHARIDFLQEAYGAFRSAGGRAFPFAVRIDRGRVYVMQNLSGIAAIEPGDAIEFINDRPIAAWLAHLSAYVSADNSYLAAALMEPQWSALLWLDGGEVDAFALRLRKPDGQAMRRNVPACNRAEMRASAENAASTLQLDPTERVAQVYPDGLAYLRPGVFLNIEDSANPDDPAAFRTFIDAAFAQFLAAGASRLLIDLRDNPGGHNAFSDHMVAWFATRPFSFCSDFRIRVSPQSIAANAERLVTEPPGGPSHRLALAYAAVPPGETINFVVPKMAPRNTDHFEGRVAVLVNRRSYSNAVAVAALIQDYGFGVVMGEPTADLATTYGSMEHFSLPHTGVTVGFPKAFIVRPNGNENVQGVAPDIEISTPIIEPAEDQVLHAARAAFHNQSAPRSNGG